MFLLEPVLSLTYYIDDAAPSDILQPGEVLSKGKNGNTANEIFRDISVNFVYSMS
jgi:hypothetical protein